MSIVARRWTRPPVPYEQRSTSPGGSGAGKRRIRPAAAMPTSPGAWLCAVKVSRGESVVRVYAESVDVQRRDATPTQFLWLGRLYLVRAVYAHWVEAGGWWRASGTGPAGGTSDGEREFWRVEAGAGRHLGTGVFDLCFVWSANCRLLGRARRPVSAWVLLTEVAPELSEWSAFFAAGAGKRAAADAGLSRAVTAREADDLRRDAETFLAVVETTLGLSHQAVLTAAGSH